MSAELVVTCSEHLAFDPTPMPVSLPACHVPFEGMAGQGRGIETEVARRACNLDRLGITGPIGCGKSSLSRYAMSQVGQIAAPIWINVATEDPEAIGTVRGFLEILISQLASAAHRATRISGSSRQQILSEASLREPLPTTVVQMNAELGASFWLLHGGIARSITRTIEPAAAYRATEDLRRVVNDVMAVIASDELVPILIADDTDRLLRSTQEDDLQRRRFTGFFGEVLRDISDHLQCGLLVAVHDRYRDEDQYEAMTDGLLLHVDVPAITESDHLAAIVDARLEFVEEGASWSNLVDPEAVGVLLELHNDRDRRSLRKTLTTFRTSLISAAARGADVVQVRDVASSAAD
jgi:hypothetical protein